MVNLMSWLQVASTGDSVVSVDYGLFRMVNSMAGHDAVFDSTMIAFAKYSPVFFALVLGALWLTWKPVNQRGALLAGSAGLIALGIGQIVGSLFPRPRPYLAHHVTLLITHSPDTSFPSDHATLGFAVGAMLWGFNRRAAISIFVVSVIMSFARVFVGAHYPSDLLGGAALGVATSVIVSAFSRRAPLSLWVGKAMAGLGRLRVAAKPPAGEVR
jgi:undecaprenyl-diphosphatase